MNIKNLILIVYFISSLLSGCGGGGGGEAPAAKTETPPPAGNYDLNDYIFHQDLRSTGGLISYPVSSYIKSDGSLAVSYNDRFERTTADTIVWQSSGSPASTFVITPSTIDETVHSAMDALRASQRFVDVGTKYMDATASLPPIGDQNARCTVLQHHDSIDLSTMTGSFSLASGIYNDVLEVNCITSFVVEGQLGEHTNLRHYFAKNVGVVFTEGNMLFFGEVYIIPKI